MAVQEGNENELSIWQESAMPRLVGSEKFVAALGM